MRQYSRRSIRLGGYDYGQSGYYFVTICIQKRYRILGNINKKRMVLNDVGYMIKNTIKWFNKFGNVCADVYCVMPNHVHLILIVGADPCVCPKRELVNMSGSTRGSTPTLGNYIKRFKTLTTRIYVEKVRKGIWEPFEKRFWQRNYYDRIIRNEEELNRIREYIRLNPIMWDRDRNNLSC